MVAFVHFQQAGCRDTNFGKTLNAGAIESKMVILGILARVEQRDNFASGWIKGCQIWPLVQIAVGAGQTEVSQAIILNVLPSLDMLNVERQERRGSLR